MNKTKIRKKLACNIFFLYRVIKQKPARGGGFHGGIPSLTCSLSYSFQSIKLMPKIPQSNLVILQIKNLPIP